MKLTEEPNHCVGAYDFHAYCKYENDEHEYDEFPHIAVPAETLGQARGALRSYGWIFHRDGTGTCPKCAYILKRDGSSALKGQQHDK